MILVRYMNYEGHGDGLRISVGTDEEIDRQAVRLRGRFHHQANRCFRRRKERLGLDGGGRGRNPDQGY